MTLFICEKKDKIMSNDVRITLRLPQNLKLQIEKLANELNISVNDAFKMVIKLGLKHFQY